MANEAPAERRGLAGGDGQQRRSPGLHLVGRVSALGAWMALSLLVGGITAPLFASSLRGSSRAMSSQIRQAQAHDFTFLRNEAQLRRFVDNGWLVTVSAGPDYELSGVSYPYTRPELRLFIERLSRQYRDACGEKLVVTSLTRPRNRQPPNASDQSVHQAGMAMDLRRSRRAKCRRWLERVLLQLEARGVLEATYEPRPPHYHVAVYPRPYKRYVERLTGSRAIRSHRVRRGDTLWGIARRYDTSVRSLRRTNGLRSDRLMPGQVLRIPG